MRHFVTHVLKEVFQPTPKETVARMLIVLGNSVRCFSEIFRLKSNLHSISNKLRISVKNVII